MNYFKESKGYIYPYSQLEAMRRNVFNQIGAELADTLYGVTSSYVFGNEKNYPGYEEDFSCFGEHVISNFLKKRVRQGKPTNYLDLAGGDGSAARQLRQRRLITKGTTVSLVDLRSDTTQERDTQTNLDLLPRDLFNRETWKELKGQDSFNIITCRPIRGFPENIPGEAYQGLLNRAYQLLSNDNGLFLFELPNKRDENLLYTYFTLLKDTPGIHAKIATVNYNMKGLLLKSQGSPLMLPTFSDLTK